MRWSGVQGVSGAVFYCDIIADGTSRRARKSRVIDIAEGELGNGELVAGGYLGVLMVCLGACWLTAVVAAYGARHINHHGVAKVLDTAAVIAASGMISWSFSSIVTDLVTVLRKDIGLPSADWIDVAVVASSMAGVIVARRRDGARHFRERLGSLRRRAGGR